MRKNANFVESNQKNQDYDKRHANECDSFFEQKA